MTILSKLSSHFVRELKQIIENEMRNFWFVKDQNSIAKNKKNLNIKGGFVTKMPLVFSTIFN